LHPALVLCADGYAPIIADMTEQLRIQDGRANNGGPRFKVRPDDRRGGLYEFIATDEERAQVKLLAKVMTEKPLAALMDISVSTLRRHFAKELAIGEAEMLRAVGTNMVTRAMSGDFQAQRLILTTRGGWTSKHELTGPGGGPIQIAAVDLSMLDDEELEFYGRLCEKFDKRNGPALIDGSVSEGEG
jgi:hypothetical protein